ncbi:hypothetical protein BCR44DRAFT_1199138 [Catenaria anguillulae PL171]|uniref:Secreted protein n=1 Tax=Catenaria anguillulae PL171 TaxID=765915 RepID=A0A1Y2HIL7_9FUNG|nr:hypothetical protein BCR44DRAFT_1199138 [Catenaria anguillulae PL171]
MFFSVVCLFFCFRCHVVSVPTHHPTSHRVPFSLRPLILSACRIPSHPNPLCFVWLVALHESGDVFRLQRPWLPPLFVSAVVCTVNGQFVNVYANVPSSFVLSLFTSTSSCSSRVPVHISPLFLDLLFIGGLDRCGYWRCALSPLISFMSPSLLNFGLFSQASL